MVHCGGRAGTTVWREPDIRFDLDGLAKGWIADRAADMLARWPGAAVDADGDIAISAGPSAEWLVDVADPRPGVSGRRSSRNDSRIRGGDSWSARLRRRHLGYQHSSLGERGTAGRPTT